MRLLLCLLLTTSAFASDFFLQVPVEFHGHFIVSGMKFVGEKIVYATAKEPVGAITINAKTVTVALENSEVVPLGAKRFFPQKVGDDFAFIICHGYNGAEVWYRLVWCENELGVKWLFFQHILVDTAGNPVPRTMLCLVKVEEQ